MKSEKQCTIKKAVSLTGVGLHTGKKVTITFNPAPENHWYKFQRTDLDGKPTIDADADLVVDTSRGTTLEQNGARVYTTEHVLAALRGLEIDNCLIQVDAPEMPIMDGSSIKFIEALEAAEIIEQEAEREYFTLKENLSFEDPVKQVEMLAVPQDTFRTTVMVDYSSEVLGTQHAGMYNLQEFKKEIAPCRTFVFLHELEMLLQHNLIKGGDLDNAIVLVDKEVPKEKLDYLRKVFHKENMEVKGRGVLNNTKLHFYNEPARHKLLDIVGDLALVGRPLKIHVLAARPGHAGNVEFAKKIKDLIKKEKREGNLPHLDLASKPLYTTSDIMKVLPHRYPFLMVDKIMELTPEYVVGVKNVTFNEFWCQGHFPDEPVMPGVLIIEALAQTGGILCLKTVPDPENYQTYFVKIESAKFKQKVVPGDTVVFRMELAAPIRRGLCHMKGAAYVGNKVVAEADMMAQIVKVRNVDKKSKRTRICMISKLAHIHPKAQIGNNVTIEPFTSISADVVIEEGSWIGPNAVLMDGTRIGKNCKIFPGAVIGGIPQDLKYKGEPSLTVIGNNTTIREYVTINKGTLDKMATKVGDNCLIMAYAHIAHDCVIGNHVIIAGYVGITGHVVIEDYAIIEGLSGAQQFITIGAHSFVAGCSQIRKSVPPFIRVAREPLQYIGVNIVGLTRRGFSKETIKNIEDIYRIIFVRGYNMTNAVEMVEADCSDTPERKQILDFITNAKDGIVKGI